MEHPKYLPEFDVVAESAAEEEALRAGRATVDVIKSAQGDIRSVRILPAEPEPAEA